MEEPKETFYPAKGKGSVRAKALCSQCPVLEQCRDFALKWEEREGERFGVWAGLTKDERNVKYGRLTRRVGIE